MSIDTPDVDTSANRLQKVRRVTNGKVVLISLDYLGITGSVIVDADADKSTVDAFLMRVWSTAEEALDAEPDRSEHVAGIETGDQHALVTIPDGTDQQTVDDWMVCFGEHVDSALFGEAPLQMVGPAQHARNGGNNE